MQNLWHSMMDAAEAIIPATREMGVTGLIVEFRRAPDWPGGGWNTVFHDLCLYDWDPRVTKQGAYRENTQVLRSSLNSLCDHAREQSLDIFQMGAEFHITREMRSAIPELLDPDGPALYEFAARRIEEVLTACAGLSGVKVYLEEVSECIMELPGSRPAAERVALMVRSLLSVCEKLAKKLIICTFALMPHQQRAIIDGLKLVEASPSLLVDNYACPGDWGRIALTNPAAGNCGPHPEILSFDYCGEIWGQSVVPFVQANLIAKRITFAREQGAKLAGFAGYVSWGDNPRRTSGRVQGRVNEVNAYIISRICATGELRVEDYVLEWAQSKYGEARGAALTPVLLRQQDSHLAAWQLLGFWVLELPKSQLPDLWWYDYSLHWESLAIWDRSYAETERNLFWPTREFIENQIMPEKDSAVEAAEANLRDVESTVSALGDPARADANDPLIRFFQRELLMNRAIRHYSAAFFHAKLATSGDTLALGEARADIESMRTLADELDREPDPGFWTLKPQRLGELADAVEEVLASGKWPAAERIARWNVQLEAWGYPVAQPPA